MEDYRMLGVKRERLRLIYEQSQAEAMKAIVPDTSKLFSKINTVRLLELVPTVVYRALDDAEAEVLHESRKGIFSYMVHPPEEISVFVCSD